MSCSSDLIMYGGSMKAENAKQKQMETTISLKENKTP